MKKNGFTLIELLVVIAIIALLLAIVMPSLGAAKEQAKSVYCRNNIKQMCIAASAYTVNNDEYYPIAHYTKITSQPLAMAKPSAGPILAVFPPDEPPSETVTYSYAWDFTTIQSGQRTQTVPGTLWQEDTTEKVQQCPSYKGSDNWAGNPYTGYNYNTSYIGHGEGESVRAGYSGEVRTQSGQIIILPAKTSSVKNLASCALFGDGHYAGGANKFMRSPMTWEGDSDWTLRQAGTQGFRHIQQTNVGWADGHVTTQRELYTDTHPKYKPSLDAYNSANKVKIGFLSPSNSQYDLK